MKVARKTIATTAMAAYFRFPEGQGGITCDTGGGSRYRRRGTGCLGSIGSWFTRHSGNIRFCSREIRRCFYNGRGCWVLAGGQRNRLTAAWDRIFNQGIYRVDNHFKHPFLALPAKTEYVRGRYLYQGDNRL
ncbi:MAG: hypothetical protein WCF90_08835 [Methanomicrobiales archaeon]